MSQSHTITASEADALAKRALAEGVWLTLHVAAAAEAECIQIRSTDFLDHASKILGVLQELVGAIPKVPLTETTVSEAK